MQLYIDPGTGSMLFTILIGLVSAGVYALRSSLLKLRFFLGGGHQSKEDEQDSAPYVIFTDDKRYWNVFEPVCDEFEARGLSVSYYTASSDDLALTKPYEYVRCEFVGEGNKAFAKMNMLKADIVLSSTTGLDVYQWKRSRDVKFYAHILHAVSDAAMYRMFGVDYFDAILLSGGHQAEQVRELERLRGLPPKELPVVGMPYMDTMAARREAMDESTSSEITVLLAPSWGKSAIFSLYGESIVDALLATGYHIVIRPHPQSFTSEREMIEGLMSKYPNSEQLEWNADNDNFDVLSRADIMISDFSGVIFDYALVFDRPVIYTEPSYNKDPYDAWWLDDELWTFKALPRIGAKLEIDSLGDMKGLIDSCRANPAYQESREAVREECWANRGKSAKAIVDYLVSKREAINAR
ncbi:MAG: CDP-glycerol glycerophosphotransferase family protein [Eggerthellaceae bacterium]|nr:CDP-glycerol glycerophosphotransferase family protein [Eggerthellaceae bacterium]